MLSAHLDPNTDAASRRPEIIASSAEFLSSFFPRNGRILDLGCGPGLYTGLWSEAGYAVTGVDLSKRSLAYARTKDHKTTYLLQNYLRLDVNETFDAVTLIYCDYAALTPKERKTLLEQVCRVLKPGGRLIFDVFTHRYFQQKKEKKVWSFCDQGGFWSNLPYLCLEATYLYESKMVSADRYVVITNGKISDYILWDTAYCPESLKEETVPAGFRIDALFDDICGAPFTVYEDTLCAVLSKEEKRL